MSASGTRPEPAQKCKPLALLSCPIGILFQAGGLAHMQVSADPSRSVVNPAYLSQGFCVERLMENREDHTLWDGHSKNPENITSVGEDMEKLEP